MNGDDPVLLTRCVLQLFLANTRRSEPRMDSDLLLLSHKALLGFRQQAEAAVAMGVTSTGEGPPVVPRHLLECGFVSSNCLVILRTQQGLHIDGA